MSQHHAVFTWGSGPNSVFVAGGFNGWSGNASPLEKQPDGSFRGEVAVPWGEKQAFKYVVDGDWKVREDEAKEWDAAGNMNNVYTAPHPPEPEPEPTPAPAPAPVVAAEPAPAAPATVDPVPEPTAASKAEPSALLAASAPGAASAGPAPALGAPVSGAGAEPTAATKAEQIEKTAAAAPIGEAKTAPQEQGEGVLGQAAALGASALAAATAAAAAAAVVVEKATGVDLVHGNPLTVEEAKAKGIDVSSLSKKDAPTDTVSPVGQKPSEAAVKDLSDKVAGLSLPNGSAKEAPKHDIPAQNETQANHTSVPAPTIVPVSAKDPSKDRTVGATTAQAAQAESKPIDVNPAKSALAEKRDAQANKSTNTTSVITGGAAAAPPSSGGVSAVAPDSKSTNTPAPAAPATKAPAPAPAPAAAAAAAPAPPKKESTPTPAPAPAPASAKPESAAPAFAATTFPAAAAPPATPAKTSNGPTPAIALATPGSLNSTPASTPAKPSAHAKESTAGTTGSGDIKKKKSFLHKIKSAFGSPKNKEKK